MLELSILGFLHEEPLHGYELKARIQALSGHIRPVSDGALYPAISRLVKAGLVEQRTEPGTGAAPRRVLSLTEAGRDELHARLGHPKEAEITDGQRFFTLLAFLHHLPDRAAQAAVLRRRQAFLDVPASFFYRDGEPVRAERAPSLFRQGMLRIARATGAEEKKWLAEAIGELEGAAVLIDTVAWVRIEGGRILCARPRGKDVFYIPGGKREGAESDVETLVREIREELTVRIDPETAAHAGTYEAGGPGLPDGAVVRMACYTAEFTGELRASSEIEDVAWFSYADRDRVPPVDQQLFDDLKAAGDLV